MQWTLHWLQLKASREEEGEVCTIFIVEKRVLIRQFCPVKTDAISLWTTARLRRMWVVSAAVLLTEKPHQPAIRVLSVGKCRRALALAEGFGATEGQPAACRAQLLSNHREAPLDTKPTRVEGTLLDTRSEMQDTGARAFARENLRSERLRSGRTWKKSKMTLSTTAQIRGRGVEGTRRVEGTRDATSREPWDSV